METWSVLEVIKPPEKGNWSQEEQLLAKQVTDQLSLALENARLFQTTRRQAEEQSRDGDLEARQRGTRVIVGTCGH